MKLEFILANPTALNEPVVFNVSRKMRVLAISGTVRNDVTNGVAMRIQYVRSGQGGLNIYTQQVTDSGAFSNFSCFIGASALTGNLGDGDNLCVTAALPDLWLDDGYQIKIQLGVDPYQLSNVGIYVEFPE